MQRLNQILKAHQILFKELLKNHTTFHIGGPAEVMVLPETEGEIIEVIRLCNALGQTPFILGGGSNLLVPDEGIQGVVIKLAENYSKHQINGERVESE